MEKKDNDNSLKYSPQTEQRYRRDSKPNTIKNGSIPRKQKNDKILKKSLSIW